MQRTPQQLRQAAWHCRRLAGECESGDARAELIAKAERLEQEAWDRPAEAALYGIGRR